MAKENPDSGLGVPTAYENSADFREIYSNSVQVAMTPYDLLVTFGHIVDNKDGNVVIKNDVGVRLSPQTFKFISMSLSGAMAAWESQFGQVGLSTKRPEDVLAALKAFSEKQNPNPHPEKKKP